MFMKVDKSIRPDQIFWWTLQETKEEIVGALIEIYVSLLDMNDWMLANATPLFANVWKEKPGNYKHGNLVYEFGQLLERILRKNIYILLDQNRVILDRCYGFVHGKSSLTILMAFLTK